MKKNDDLCEDCAYATFYLRYDEHKNYYLQQGCLMHNIHEKPNCTMFKEDNG